MMQTNELDLCFQDRLEQQFSEIIPLNWSIDQEEREAEVAQVTEEMKEFLLRTPQVLPYAVRRVNVLRNQSPYHEFVDVFYKFGMELFKEPELQQIIQANLLGKNLIVKKKRICKYFQDSEVAELHRITSFLHKEIGSPNYEKTVRKVKLNELDSDGDWDEDQITYDPTRDQKLKLNILLMKKLSYIKFQKLLADLYTFGNGKITNLSQIYLMFPDYLKLQCSIMKKVFTKKRGIVYQDVLALLAILAAAGQECKYLIQEMAEKYMSVGGEQSILYEGYSAFTPRIRKVSYLYRQLSQYNKQLQMNYLLNFQKGLDDEKIKMSEQIWTREQLMQAIIMLAVIQCECTVQQALGIQAEITCTFEERISSFPQNSSQQIQQTDTDQETFVQNEEGFTKIIHSLSQIMEFEEESEDGFTYTNHFLGQSGTTQDYWYKESNSTTPKKAAKLSSSEFNWRDNCQFVVKDVFPKLAHKLNKRYQIIHEMAESKMWQQGITPQLWEAVFRFSQLVLGYIDDGYDYQQLKTHLPKGLQSFIRKLIHRPWKIKSMDFESIPVALRPCELLYLVMLVANAKMYTQILFGLRNLD